LNNHYYGTQSEYENSMLAGSWGRSTQVRPPRDIDILFFLPWSVYTRVDSLSVFTNKQSALLQEVKSVLAKKYSSTKLRADGQVVIVPFYSYSIEVVPAFKLVGGDFWVCDTNSGGSYKKTNPIAEQGSVMYSNTLTKGNTRDLIKMIKTWQKNCHVSLKSFVIELLVVDFLRSWQYAGKAAVYYDWMVRDFFLYLTSKKSSCVVVSGTFEVIWLGDTWFSKAVSASQRASKACEYEASQEQFNASREWQKIFGTYVPLII
jgi:hypothetical protein